MGAMKWADGEGRNLSVAPGAVRQANSLLRYMNLSLSPGPALGIGVLSDERKSLILVIDSNYP